MQEEEKNLASEETPNLSTNGDRSTNTFFHLFSSGDLTDTEQVFIKETELC